VERHPARIRDQGALQATLIVAETAGTLSFRWVGRWCRVLDSTDVSRINRRPNLAWRDAFCLQLDHDTRDPKADFSGRGHAVEDDRPVGVHPLNVTVPVVLVPVFEMTAAEAGHVPHDLAVNNLEFVQSLNITARLEDEVRPLYHREVAIRLVSWCEGSKAISKGQG
jgi:hypothetical protein